MFDEILSNTIDLLLKKNMDYGNAWQELAIITVTVRLLDKLRRCENILLRSAAACTDEGVQDTLQDMIGYCLLGMLWLDYSVATIDTGRFGLPVKEVSADTLHRQTYKIYSLGKVVYTTTLEAFQLLNSYIEGLLHIELLEGNSIQLLSLITHSASTIVLAEIAYICCSLLLAIQCSSTACENDGTFLEV